MHSNSSSFKRTITSPSEHRCKKCGKTFETGTALGGHMTAHRDRNLSRRALNVNGENKNWPTARPHFPVNVQPPPVDAPIPGTGFNHAAPAPCVQPPPVDAPIPGTGFNHAAPAPWVQPPPVDAPIPGIGFNHAAPAPWVQPCSGEHEQGSTTVLGNPGGGEFGSNLEFALDFYKAELAAEEADLELKL